MDDAALQIQTRRVWFVILAALVVWVLLIALFGYPAVIIGALGLTALAYLSMLVIMRGK